MHRSIRYRVYPTPEQAARLLRWESALRFLWNLAHEQRLMGLARCRGEKRYPGAFDQCRELTELRRELPWLRDVPCTVAEAVLANLDHAWTLYFKRAAMRPRWKRAGRDAVAIRARHNMEPWESLVPACGGIGA